MKAPPLSESNILQLLAEQNTDKVKIAVTDIDGVLRGKMISYEKFCSIAQKGFGFCNVIFGWDSNDAAYDNVDFSGWHTGYPDTTALIDFNTFRQIPWENDTPFFIADFKDEHGNGLPVCPRSLLKKIIADANSDGYLPFAAQEFEWFNLLDNAPGMPTGKVSDTVPITTGMFGYSILRSSQRNEYFNDLFDLLKKFGVPLEGLHTETGPGVYEAAITYSDMLEAADRAVLFKTGVKQIARQHGIIATFMAKFSESLPGCSGHVHQSLWSKDGKSNLFFDKKAANGISSQLENYMAGQLYCLPYILPLFAPTVNSYKRLVEGAWAPTTITWGIDNRTTALRALPGGPAATRLETRVVGSDSNPYLAMAGCLAAGLYGIRKKLQLPAVTTGNGYANIGQGILPKNLLEATQTMKNSPLATELFGKEFVDHFTATREWEWRQYSRVVTDWELKRYLEII